MRNLTGRSHEGTQDSYVSRERGNPSCWEVTSKEAPVLASIGEISERISVTPSDFTILRRRVCYLLICLGDAGGEAATLRIYADACSWKQSVSWCGFHVGGRKAVLVLLG